MEKKAAYCFAGQGDQKKGMIEDLFRAYACVRQTFEEASDTLGRDMAEICFRTDAETLNRTENAQPALLTVETAIFRVLHSHGAKPQLLAGFSLGECSAAVAGGAVSFPAGLKLVIARAEAMRKCPEGRMIALLGITEDAAEALCVEAGRSIWIANLNCTGQFVAAGTLDDAAALQALAQERGILHRDLAVSVPSHCPLMQGAAEEFESYLRNVEFADSTVPIITNADAKPTLTGAELKTKLVRQLTQPIQFIKTFAYFEQQQITHLIEIGPGKTISGLARRAVPAVTRCMTGNEQQLQQAIQIETGPKS